MLFYKRNFAFCCHGNGKREKEKVIGNDIFDILKLKLHFQLHNLLIAPPPKACNREWSGDFEKEFAMNASDFYDFPFHPKVLDYGQFLAYCRLADRQTQCFIERCGDQVGSGGGGGGD